MPILFVNNFSTVLGGSLGSSSPGTTGQTVTLATGQGANLPVVAAPDVMFLTITEGANQEVVQVTTHTGTSDTITVTRGVEGIGGAAATAVAYTTAATIEARINKGMLASIAQADYDDTIAGNWTFNSPLVLNSPASDPTAAASGTLKLYSKQIAGRNMPKWVGPSGVTVVAQPALFGNNIVLWTPNSTTNGFWQGTTGSASGTFTDQIPITANTNTYNAIHRSVWKSVVTTANQSVGQRQAQLMFFRGNTASLGGFFFTCRFGLETWTAGDRLFVGLNAGSNTFATTPISASFNYCGFVIDAGETAITFQTNAGSGTATKTTIAGQPTLSSSLGYDAYIYCRPNDSTIYYRLDAINSQTTLINSQSTATLPNNSSSMNAMAVMSNGANTTVGSAGIGVSRIYVETDY